MRLILIGSEYAGKTTLANEITTWLIETMGSGRTFHDHFTIPPSELPEAEQEEFLRMSPELQAMFQRYCREYHLLPSFYSAPDHMLVGFHIEEAVYAPLYYSYGDSDDFSAAARAMEQRILEQAPDTVLILLKASSEVIAKRLRETPHQHTVLREQDVEHVLQRFEEEYEQSLLSGKFVLDTTSATVEETLAEFVSRIDPFLSQSDRLRMMTHQALQQNEEFSKLPIDS
jgi:shikimate kinase